MDFKELGISNKIINDLEANGIVKPTIVQVKTIPLIMAGKDVMVQSETGSGKTIGFAVPTIEKSEPQNRIQVLVITPTRELAKQVEEEYDKFSKSKKLKTTVVYGGVSIDRQANQVRQADIVVGTPGRLLDLINRRMINLTYVKFMVLDEADRMLDMGFITDINKIIKFLPSQRQNLMFSATINSSIVKLMTRYLKDPEQVLLENVIKKGILNEVYYNVRENEKISLLIHLLNKFNPKLTLIFCNTKHMTRFVADALKQNGFKADCMNGDMTQASREQVLTDFAKEKIKILVATDVAARGIHVEDITYVINYDLPSEAETYTHRVGRTARAGNTGAAIILLSEKDYKQMDRIMREHKNIKREDAGEFKQIRVEMRREPRRGGFNRSRSSGGNRRSSSGRSNFNRRR